LRDYEYGYDPFWVRAYPYRVELQLPHGFAAEPRILGGTVAAKSRATYRVKLTVEDRAALGAGVRIVPLDITLDGKRHGALFDFIVLGRDTSQ
jgi:hypothetical protein